jgi:diguanylate cyclase (GGDEF)-like protein
MQPMLKMSANPPHRLARANYGPRSLGFAASFMVILLLALERGWPFPELIFPGLYLLLFPHLLLFWSAHRGAGKKLEMQAMRLDNLVLGVLVAWVDFYPWLSFAFLVATVLNNAVVGGLRLMLESLVLFAAGVALGGWVTGWTVVAEASLLIQALSMALLLAYALLVGFVAYEQNGRLVDNAREISERNRIFRALLEISASADLATDVDEFIDEALERVHRIYPKNGMGLIVRQAGRPEVVRFASFAGIPETEQEVVLRDLGAMDKPEGETRRAIEPFEGVTFQVLFMKSEIRGHEGMIVVRTQTISQLLNESMGLFLELLGTTIENKLMALELRHAAERDPLTGVFNRGYLEAELAHAIRSRQQHPGMDFAVVLVDAVGLKNVNDTHGHAAGDRVIQATADALRGLCRATDVLVRYGGDEFVILCHGSDRQGAEGLVRRIEETVRGGKVNIGENDEDSHYVALHLSIGVASSSETPPDRVLIQADDRMYQNKKAWYEEHGVDPARSPKLGSQDPNR